jgi:hypothetical protein
MKYALALSALLLASPAMAGNSLREAAKLAVQVDTCGAKIPNEIIQQLLVRGSMEENITINDAGKIAIGMQLAYTDIIARMNMSADFCVAAKQVRTQ